MKKILFILAVILLTSCEKDTVDENKKEEESFDFLITNFKIQDEPIAVGQLINATTSINKPEVYEYTSTYILLDKNEKEVLTADGFKADINTRGLAPGEYILKTSIKHLKTSIIKTEGKKINIIEPLFGVAALGNTKEKTIETVKNLYKKDEYKASIGLANPLSKESGVEIVKFQNIEMQATTVYYFKNGKFAGGEIYSVKGYPYSVYTSWVEHYSKKFNEEAVLVDESFHYFSKEQLEKLIEERDINTINTIMINGQYYVSHKWDTNKIYGFIQPMGRDGVIQFYFYSK